MKFIDEIEIEVAGGRGGDGCCSFRREKYVPRGGPDGGDGGDGGNVIFRTTPHRTTLHHLANRRLYEAENGRPGKKKKMHGRDGEDLVVDVPMGTLVRDKKGRRIADLSEQDQTWVAARGGRGGKGNVRFASATNQVPREWTPGEEGEQRTLQLELKLLADVGLVGLPNAGKSTLIRQVSSAEPKVAGYPFTTLEPALGIVSIGRFDTAVFADIPGLIEGAHEGRGLGDDFLRHIERTGLLLHVVDISGVGMPEPVEAYRTIRGELTAYSESLAEKPEIVVANKSDTLLPEEVSEKVAELEEATGREVVAISAVAGTGIDTLLKVVAGRLESLEKTE